MNLLTPLYAAAALAISVPILLHLVRRQPKNRFEFSSLLFLSETPPRLTRNRRIEHWFLLLLRSLLVLMLAFAFARPYWNSAIHTPAGAAVGKRKCIVIDRSASMQREGVWQNAIQQARDAIRTARPTDTIAVYSFDAELHTHLPLSQARGLPIGKRTASALAAIDSLNPSWSQSDLGTAIVSCLDALQVDSAENDDANSGPAEIIVISDLTTGCDVRALEQEEWPEDICVQLIRATPSKIGNASFVFLDPEDMSGPAGEYRVRVSNARDSLGESFQLRWIDSESKEITAESIECTVPRGSQRIVKLPPPSEFAAGIELLGDDCPFDNRRFLVIDALSPSLVCIVEEDGLPPEESLAFFLERIPFDTPYRKVQIQRCQPDSDWLTAQSKTPAWVILSHAATLRDADQCRQLLQKGGYVSLIMDQPANIPHRDGGTLGDQFQKLTNRCTEVEIGALAERKVSNFELLQRLEFGHPVLAPLANSQFNDFSKVRFWRHRTLGTSELSGWQVLAWFGENHPAIMQRDVDRGKFLLMTAGWQPVESQLALSSKFVPLMAGIYSQAQPDSGQRKEWIAGNERAPKPGIYDFKEDSSENASGQTRRIAANLDPRESQTDPLDPSELTRFGVRLASDQPSEKTATERERVLVATELEARQAWWWWLVSACLVAVGLESLLCWSRSATAPSLSLAKE